MKLIAMKYILRPLLVTLFVISLSTVYSQSYWKNADINSTNRKTNPNLVLPTEFELFLLDTKQFRKVLKAVPKKGDADISNGHIIYLPTSKGEVKSYRVLETPVFDEELSKKYPSIKSFTGQGVDDPSEIVKFSMSQLGFKCMHISVDSEYEYTESYAEEEGYYLVYQRKDKLPESSHFECTLKDIAKDKLLNTNTRSNVNDGINRTFRLVVSTTGEYTEYFGGTVAGALAAINASITRVNAIFETDLNVTFELIAATENVIYTDASTDPYSPGNSFFNVWSEEVQSILTDQVGAVNYDLGHLFGVAQHSGNAGYISSVCTDGEKGSAWSSSYTPEGDGFDVSLLCHEIGHQFGANHTWSYKDDEGFDAHVEPASGTTIMSYAGITKSANVQESHDPYFHAKSIQQMTDFINTISCQVEEDTGNTAPTVDAGLDYSIPSGTPFVLTGTAIDPDGDVLSYCWEQMDEDDALTKYPNVNATTGVAFRSLNPTSSNERVFPEIATVLDGQTASTWEAIPDVERELNFRLTVRDNVAGGGTTESDDMVVSVKGNAGPFEITTPSTDVNWAAGTAKTISWNVAGTDAAPINTNAVNIYLSTDGGSTFETIVENTANDGAYNYVVPDNLGTTNRIKIESVGNIFFDISDSDFNIVELVPCAGTTPANMHTVNVQDFIAEFTWDNVAGAGGYDFRFREVGTTTWTTSSVNTNFESLTNLAASTSYEAQVRTVCLDNSTSPYSALISFSTIAAYCSPIYNSGEDTPTTRYISNISLGTIDNSSGSALDGYSDFVQLSTDIAIDSDATIEITPSWPGQQDMKFGVWIDFNGDSDFDDPGEQVLFFLEECKYATPLSRSFNIPMDAIPGSTRMRVAVSIDYNSFNACSVQYYGETEDYTVNLIPNCSEIENNNAESGWGIWNDGGSDAHIFYNPTLSNSGNYSFVIRDNTNSSVITSDDMDLSEAAEVFLDFNFVAVSMDNSAEDFWLQLSTDGGSTFTTIEEWNYSDEFTNDVRVFESLSISGPFSENTQFRFRCDASSNNDLIYIDDIVIDLCLAIPPTCNDGIQNGSEIGIDCGGLECSPCNVCNVFDFNDGESGWVNWVDGGENADLIDNADYANSGTFSFLITRNTNTSVITTNTMDLTNANNVLIDYNFFQVDILSGQLFLESSFDNGNTFHIEETLYLSSFYNDSRQFKTISIPGNFTSTTQFRFRLQSSNDLGTIYIDDIKIESCETINPTCDDGLKNGEETGIDCGGPTCPSCLFCETLDFNNAETGWGIWNDGGEYARLYNYDVYARSGEYSFLVQASGNESHITSNNMDLSSVPTAVIDFNFISPSMDCETSLWLQVSTDEGNTFTTVKEWVYIDDFVEDERIFSSVEIQGPFTETTQFRIRSNAISTLPYFLIDDIKIEACSSTEIVCNEYNINDFESGVGIWNGGGSDAFLVYNTAYANSGIWSYLIRDNTATSVITTDAMDMSNASEIIVDFNFLAVQMDNPNEDFWLQVSMDGGASFTTIEEWNLSDEFENDVRVFESVTIPGPFTASTQLRFRCDASSNNDYIFLDDISIEACEGSGPTCDDGIQNGDETGVDCGGTACPSCIVCEVSDSNDFESGVGIWNGGGSDAFLVYNTAYANSGIWSYLIRDNTATSVITTNTIDMSNASEVIVDFNFLAVQMDNPNEDFWLQVSMDGGATFTTVAEWNLSDEFENDVRVFESVSIPGPFTTSTQIRFRCDASSNNDYIFLDDIVIEACEDNSEAIIGIASSRSKDMDNLASTTDDAFDMIKLFPNPVHSKLHVQVAEGEFEMLTILSSTGQAVYQKRIETTNISIDVSGLGSGVYMLRLQDAKGMVESKKFIKQ